VDTGVADQLDVPLEDETLLEEVELVSTLMIAASGSAHPLPQEEIDALLGLSASGRVPAQPDKKGHPTA
jgi:hypothetical protein